MSKKVQLNQIAPEFVLDDHLGVPVRLSDYRGVRNVVLIFNRGFV